MSDPMQEIMASFFIECEELLEALLDALQLMVDGESDTETINVAFRSVHSIKGGAGAFGLDDLVSFAHQFETVMDECRSGTLEIGEKLVDLFFRCTDMLSDLVRCSRDGEAPNTDVSNGLITELAGWSSADADAEEEALPEFAPMTIDLGDFGGDTSEDNSSDEPTADLSDLPLPDIDLSPETSGKSQIKVKFTPDPELYVSGNEPLFFMQTMADLGPCKVEAELSMPPETIEGISSIGKRLTWHISIDTEENPSAIHDIFEFADGLCKLEVTQEKSEGTTELKAVGNAEPEPEKPVVETPAEAPPVATISDNAPTEKTAIQSNKPPEKAAKSVAKSAPNAKASPTVRVDLDRIERLVNLVGELVINQAMMSQSIAEEDIHQNSAIFSGLDEFMQLTRDIQESVMMIRAQPVKSLFQRMSRIVREASAAVEKNVRLVTEGENTEIDKTAIERLADPLTHMIRNAVDHGLETTETRLAGEKSEVGSIRLSAAHKSGRVVIEVADDGAGINREKVLSKAIAKELVAEDATLSDSEIDQLLFLPGFSTADQVSNLSGRGVGMDVVKTQIAALGGRVTIDSTPGQGTTFSISLPLTLAVLDGMVISVAGETLVIPINTIVETLSLTDNDLTFVAPNQHVIRVRDKFVPVLDLGTELGYRAQPELDSGAIALLISPEEGLLVALLVDEIEDQRQVVIKGLQDSYGRVPGVAAATILGDGQIALILDPADLVQGSPVDDLNLMSKKAS